MSLLSLRNFIYVTLMYYNQKKRVLNLNKHPAAYWMYTRSAVPGVLTTLLIFPS
jgi:hypothetical protein